MKRSLLLATILFSGAASAIAQSVGINTTGAQPHSSSILDVSSTTKGVLIPRMTGAQRTAIAGPATGLQVYQTDGVPGFYFYNGASWAQLGAAAGANNNTWNLNGNAGTLGGGQNFIGTTDKQNLDFRTYGQQRLRLDTSGNLLFSPGGKVGIGTTTPQSFFEIAGYDPTTANAAFRVLNYGDNNRAADFFSTSSTTIQPAISGYVVGNNSAASFVQANTQSARPTLTANSNGHGGAGYFSTDYAGAGDYSILKSVYTGTATNTNITAVKGIANLGNNNGGTGGDFQGGYLGVKGTGSYGGLFNGTLVGLDVSVAHPTSLNTNFYGISCKTNVSGTPNANTFGISSYVNGGASSNVFGFYSDPHGTGPYITCFQGFGNINITGSYYSSSDRKLKQNIQPMQTMMDKIMRLTPSTYQYRTAEYNMNLPKGNQYGLVAQDIQAVFPELVQEQIRPETKNATGEIESPEIRYLGVNYQGLIPIVIRGMQQQEQEIKTLEKENAQLKKEIAAIKAKLGL